MAPFPRRSPPAGEAPPQPSGEDVRLDSWKEIAAFLQRDVRTVQRWEKTAGLPVYRHPSSRLRTAYAYRSELEAWWRARPRDFESVPVERRRWAPRTVVAATAVVLVLAAAGWLAGKGRESWTSHRAEAAPRSPAVVLLSRLEVPASRDALGRLLNELVADRFRAQAGVSLVPPARVTRLLGLMRQEPQAPLTPAISREMAARDGGIDLVVTGEVHRLDSRAIVHLRLVAPGDGRIRASAERHTSWADGLALATRQAAHELALAAARHIDEGPRSRGRLEQVTTASLRALRLYTAAVEAGDRGQWAASEMLARRAVAADEEFASAHAWIGWAVRQQGRPARHANPHFERAAAFSPGISDPEIHFIAGAHHEVAGDLPRAIAAYEALLRLQPENRRALDRLIAVNSRAGRMAEAVDLAVRRAELLPSDFSANVRAAHALTLGQPAARADSFLERARGLATPAAVREHPVWGAWLSVVPVFRRETSGDSTGAIEALTSIERGLDTRSGRERDAFATAVGFSHLALGRPDHARRAFRLASTPVYHTNMAIVALQAGDERVARESLNRIAGTGGRPVLFAWAGLRPRADAFLAGSTELEQSAGISHVTQGVAEARRGRTDRAMALLQEGVERLRYSGEPEYFLAVQRLAELHRSRGNDEMATTLLTEACKQEPGAFGTRRWAGAQWLKLNIELLSARRDRRR